MSCQCSCTSTVRGRCQDPPQTNYKCILTAASGQFIIYMGLKQYLMMNCGEWRLFTLSITTLRGKNRVESDIPFVRMNNVLHVSRWSGTHWNFYKTLSPTSANQYYPINVSRREIMAFTRFRMGHSRLTHQHYLDANAPSQYIFCLSNELSIQHIVDECPEVPLKCQQLDINGLDYDYHAPQQKTSSYLENFLDKLICISY